MRNATEFQCHCATVTGVRFCIFLCSCVESARSQVVQSGGRIRTMYLHIVLAQNKHCPRRCGTLTLTRAFQMRHLGPSPTRSISIAVPGLVQRALQNVQNGFVDGWCTPSTAGGVHFGCHANIRQPSTHLKHSPHRIQHKPPTHTAPRPETAPLPPVRNTFDLLFSRYTTDNVFDLLFSV